MKQDASKPMTDASINIAENCNIPISPYAITAIFSSSYPSDAPIEPAIFFAKHSIDFSLPNYNFGSA
jgi:hypothetical protein